MSKMQRLGGQVDRLEYIDKALSATSERCKPGDTDIKKNVTDRATEYHRHAEFFAQRFEDLQRTIAEKTTEIYLARQQRERNN
jgi:hypothetical protein